MHTAFHDPSSGNKENICRKLVNYNIDCAAITSGHKPWFRRLYKDDFKEPLYTHCLVDFKATVLNGF